MRELVDQFLACQSASHLGNNIKLNPMKSIGLYHRNAFELQVRDYVLHPKRSWMQDNAK
ncbi:MULTISPECIES: hypothetical protein [Kosakonia]|uniref:hypothetical protein n=1 Tax=Kosakonia TaxID=1330547 RepID=UPI0014820924|nr:MULTISPECIES: hypothetical protein [Kosakonia]